VSLDGEAVRLFDLAAIYAARTGSTVSLVSANDHLHSVRSAHYRDAAVDLHANEATLDGLRAWYEERGYRVLWRVPGHYGHLHAEAAQ
jgi:hypothetical protein